MVTNREHASISSGIIHVAPLLRSSPTPPHHNLPSPTPPPLQHPTPHLDPAFTILPHLPSKTCLLLHLPHYNILHPTSTLPLPSSHTSLAKPASIMHHCLSAHTTRTSAEPCSLLQTHQDVQASHCQCTCRPQTLRSHGHYHANSTRLFFADGLGANSSSPSCTIHTPTLCQEQHTLIIMQTSHTCSLLMGAAPGARAPGPGANRSSPEVWPGCKVVKSYNEKQGSREQKAAQQGQEWTWEVAHLGPGKGCEGWRVT
eukprot:1157486-Pelagomonas_calceolata.AAC.10